MFFNEIGEIHLLKCEDEKIIIDILEKQGYYLRLYEELEDENIYYIVVHTE